jgi:hypothetical protein
MWTATWLSTGPDRKRSAAVTCACFGIRFTALGFEARLVKLYPEKTDMGKNYEELSKTYYDIVNR